MQLQSRFLRVFAALVCIGSCWPHLASAQAAPEAPAEMTEVFGSWIGSRLQCRKDESGPVRCGTPAPFQIALRKDGTGVSQGEGFPPTFTFKITGPGKMVITSTDGARTFEIFEIKVESDFISFQMYFYPDAGKSAGEGEDYLHYIFDLAKQDDTIPQP
jgi:hypothetical protein